MVVLSIFDGMSCGQIALEKAGIEVENYFASEVKPHAIKVTQHNFPNTIQLGDVTKIKIKLLCLSEVYSYICNYDSNLQSNISEWEVLYWINKDFTLSAKIRTQKPNERQEVSEPSTVQRIEEVWFSKREMGSVRKFGDYTRSRSNGEENDIRTPQQLQCGKWWYDNDIYRRYKEENIGITIGKTKNGDSEKKNFGNIEEAIFKGRESEGCFRENKKSNVEKGCSGKLFERKKEDRFSREVEKEKGNRRTKEGNFIDEVIRELCRWDESDGITQDYWSLLRLHKEEQITVVEYEEGLYMFKGRIDLCIGGSPCQDFSLANKEKLGLQGKKSGLFYEYLRLLKECEPKYFLLENVVMDAEQEMIISELVGTEPVRINSSLLSAQLRDRLYWTNIGQASYDLFGNRTCAIPLPKNKKIKLQDVLEDGFTDREKSRALLESDSRPLRTPTKMFHRYYSTGFTTVVFKDESIYKEMKRRYEEGLPGDAQQLNPSTESGGQQPYMQNRVYSDKGKAPCLTQFADRLMVFQKENIRYLTQTELERLQTVPEGYTSILKRDDAACLLGDGWTVDVIAHIFSFINEYKKNKN